MHLTLSNDDRACSPFHAAPGITTCRMLIHLRKVAAQDTEVETDSNLLPNLEFQDP